MHHAHVAHSCGREATHHSARRGLAWTVSVARHRTRASPHAAKRLAIVSRRSDAGTITPRRTVSLLTAQVGRKLTGVSAWTRSRKRSDRGGLAAPLVDGVAHAPRRDRASEPRRRAAHVRLPAVLFTGPRKKGASSGKHLKTATHPILRWTRLGKAQLTISR